MLEHSRLLNRKQRCSYQNWSFFLRKQSQRSFPSAYNITILLLQLTHHIGATERVNLLLGLKTINVFQHLYLRNWKQPS